MPSDLSHETTASPAAQATTHTLVRTPIIVRHAGLKVPTLDDVLHALGGPSALVRTPVDVLIDTMRFADDINAANWGASHGEVWRKAEEVRQLLQQSEPARLIYSGMPEVAHAVAFGAYIGEHWPVEPYDYHEQQDSWAWPERDQTLTLSAAVGVPADLQRTAGPAVLRIELTYAVKESDVALFVPEEERVADIRIVPEGGPRPRLVRSLADVAAVRRSVQQAITTLVTNRPALTVLHLFISAPVSVCVVTGQELRIRNHPPVQTYRYRRGPDGQGVMREALRLTSTGPATADVPPTEEERAQAAVARQQFWEPAIRDVERYAERKEDAAQQLQRAGGPAVRWYQALGGRDWRRALDRFNPFPSLPPVQRVVERPTTEVTAPADPEIEFGFQREDRRWLIGDPLVLGFERHFPEPSDRKSLIRIFLFHEYLHLVHGITKASAREVGKFANGLEHADYLSDLYGILHELDWEADEQPALRSEFRAFQRRAAELINLVIRSFWAFEPPAPLEELEFRRLRRYMNWYWQLQRVRMSNDWTQLAAVLVRQPVVEIAGLQPRVESRRYYGSLRRFDPAVGLELGIVLDSEQLHRVKSGTTTPLAELMEAFRVHDHGAIQNVFRGIYAEIEGTGNSLPRVEQYPPECADVAR
jgi:hypothetical protein